MIKKWLLVSVLLATIAVGTASGATLELSPSSGCYQVGDTFTVDILLDTEGIETQGVGIRYLNYPTELLEVIDAEPETPGVQILAGKLYTFATPLNKVDTINGRIAFSQLSFGFCGSGTLATVRFKTINSGEAQVTFDFTPGDTTDCNVASNGVEVLSSVTNGCYEISAPVVISCDASGTETNSFDLSEDVYCYAGNLPASTPVDIYVVNNKDDWEEGNTLSDVSGGIETVATGDDGSISITQIWGSPLTQGSYDIVVDTNRNGEWNEGEPIDDKMNVGFEAIPEFTTIAIPIAAIIGLLFLFSRRRKKEE